MMNRGILFALLALCVASALAVKVTQNNDALASEVAHEQAEGQQFLEVASQVSGVSGGSGAGSTVDQSGKVYWVTPGDGTVSISWLMLGITLSGVCFGATALTAIVFLCCCQKKEVAEDV